MKKLFIDEVVVSDRYDVARQTLRNWRSMNRFLPYYKIGRKVLYRDDEVMEFFNSKRIEVCDY